MSFLQKDYELINEQFSNPNPLIKNIINFNDLNKSWDDLKKSPRKHATRSSVPSKIFSFVVLNRWLDYEKQKYEKAWKKYITCVSFYIMNKKEYISPEIVELGKAKDIIKSVFVSGTGDTFPGTEDTLASS